MGPDGTVKICQKPQNSKTIYYFIRNQNVLPTSRTRRDSLYIQPGSMHYVVLYCILLKYYIL